MEASLVYSDTSVSSTDGTISVGHHTSSINFLNLNTTTDAVVKLNGQYSVVIPKAPSGGGWDYTEIFGDYTKFEVVTANVSLAVFAVG
jgi:hypothetical protein